ncbi:Hypothetical protein P9303_27961 [Prochlorococcus marinus str. MIT 9303]|uniref:Uncharacterized protein n=1 Tax=Prochlorococcus marinus (strain MIT 9303) TaxID=59922 RepID=A2CDG6_PROM3|nr:Hypothetical protein P9303_27961 [Prochlorococcus marinus str. MIT 9303]
MQGSESSSQLQSSSLLMHLAIAGMKVRCQISIAPEVCSRALIRANECGGHCRYARQWPENTSEAFA